MLKNRRSKLRQFFDKYSLDCILFKNMSNIRYLSGFTGSEATILLTRDDCWFLCDSRYLEQASEEVGSVNIIEYRSQHETIIKLVKEQSFSRIGFEATHSSVTFFTMLSNGLCGQQLIPLGSELDDIRFCKDQDELKALEDVAAVASESLMAVISSLSAGVRERDFAFQLEMEMRQRGADGKAFDFIVASGLRGAMPHGVASDKLIQSGELVTIDFGAIKNGYHSDETVTVAVGNPDQKLQEIHEVVRIAHDMAIDAAKPGISCNELDSVAREYIKRRGYGDYFGHGLGHGVGLDIHESPTISPRSKATVKQGMVFTIEPGIYIPGLGGVRIEDSIEITADGCRLLTKVPKQLLIL